MAGSGPAMELIFSTNTNRTIARSPFTLPLSPITMAAFKAAIQLCACERTLDGLESLAAAWRRPAMERCQDFSLS